MARNKLTIRFDISKARKADDHDTNFCNGQVSYYLAPEQETGFLAWLEPNLLQKVEAVAEAAEGEYEIQLDVHSWTKPKKISKKMDKATMLEVEGVVIGAQEALRQMALTGSTPGAYTGSPLKKESAAPAPKTAAKTPPSQP